MLKVAEGGYESINESVPEYNLENYRIFNDHYELVKDPTALIGMVSETFSLIL
jgi:hypothetical protein